MTDYRDPNRPPYRDPDLSTAQPWSNATWGWIAGIAVVVLVLIFAFGSGSDRMATDKGSPPATAGQRSIPPPGGVGPKSEAPSNQPATPRPAPSPDPAPPR